MERNQNGGPSVSETARRGSEAGPREWGWVDATIWTEPMLAALENGVKGGRWYSLFDKVSRASTLGNAWSAVRANRGASGVDGVSVERFDANADKYLEELHGQLASGAFRPLPVRRAWIPKAGGGSRPLGIPAVKDRVAQAALKLVLEPIFEKEFLPGSYGFRPGRGAKDALREVDRSLKEGFTHVVDADLKSYFDSIPHDRLMGLLSERVSDGRVLGLVRAFIEAKVLDGLEGWTPAAGTPQGGVISPLLANVYLHPLDLLMAREGFRVVRYADDFVIMCENAAEADRALGMVQEWVAANGLALHPEKTRVGDCMVEGQGFEFLGYRFECGRRMVRKKSRMALRDKIRLKTGRTRGDSLETIVKDLNRTLKGWYAYFKHAHRSNLLQADQFVRRRVRSILRKQEKRPGMGKCLEDHMRWPIAFFRGEGLFTMVEARDLECQPR